MNAALRPLLRIALGLLTIISLAPFALAQEEDATLQRYTLGMENLAQAVKLMPDDSLQSTDALERASQALRFLSGSSNSTELVAQLENTFTRAKETIQNQSLADLEVQVSVLKGGFQRLVYEAAITSANAGDLATTQARLAKIASNIGLSPEVQTSLQNENDLSKLFATFEAATASVVKAHLGNVLGWLDRDKGVSYRTLATAYSNFLIVQDSPRADAASSSLFTEAFPALIDNDTETLSQVINQLNTQMDAFANAANAVVSSTAPVSTAPIAQVEPSQVVQPEAIATTTETPVEVSTQQETAPADLTAPETATPDTAAVTSTVMPVATANPFAQTLKAELAGLNVSANQQAALADKWLENGFTSAESVVNELMAKTGLAMSAVQTGDQSFAKTQLAEVQSTYNSFLSPVLNSRNTSVDSSVTGLLSSLSASPSLRQQDLATLNQQWANLANDLGVSSLNPGMQGLNNGVTGFWSGWPRMIVMIVLGILAFVPLYLLFLAFGGGNRNWQLIGYALFLLLVPVIYEGLSFLLSLVNSFVGSPALEILSRFSFFQNPVMQVVWAVLTGVAIALATMGLYGICVQFGLLGRKNDDLSGTVVETSPSMSSIEKAKTTNFEWDEEF
jgi:hypothetical protein